MSRAIDAAKEAGRQIQQQIEATRRTYAPRETTPTDQRIAHDDPGSGAPDAGTIDKSAWPPNRSKL
ncbi:MAG TPA: hypothetical protein VKA15_09150 [Isosphaeraceae bacterium]|nr:hypothetical protein [Isosphaeraceae bacterium]